MTDIEAIGPIHMVIERGRLLALEFGDIEHRLMSMLRQSGWEPIRGWLIGDIGRVRYLPDGVLAKTPWRSPDLLHALP